MIKVENVYKRYLLGKHEVDVLQGADLEIESGESIAVVGRSGAGKSTLLHILGALDRPDSGRVLLDGEDVYALSNKRRSRIRCERIGFVFQSYHLLPEMDVLENVMLPGMALGGLPRTTLREKASELLDMVGLADRCGHLPQELSGGEQQRVALARSLMNNPNMLMADEPTGNLDAATGSQVLDYVFGVISDRKHTLVMVTHDETIAQRCDRVYRLENGLVHGM